MTLQLLDDKNCVVMTMKDISKLRLESQKVAFPGFDSAVEVINWMGAIQAQDLLMSKWALGCRMKEPSEKKVDNCINDGSLLRTHLLRPTWHFVSSENIRWMLDLSAPRILSSLKARERELELTPGILSKCNKILSNSLSGNRYLDRKQIEEKLENGKISIYGNRLSHILFHAEMERLICSGPIINGKPTYALFEERVPPGKKLHKDESLAKLAKLYFTSRYPATVEDFAWWSNLSLSEAGKAAGFLDSSFTSENIGNRKYIVPQSFTGRTPGKKNLFLLPAYDEFLISYKDRSPSLATVHNKKALSSNGIFYPTIVLDGQVKGTWRREVKNDKVVIETSFFEPPGSTMTGMIEAGKKAFARFICK